MIVVDVRTTGNDPTCCGIVSIGAIDYETQQKFYKECRVAYDHRLDFDVFRTTGFTKDQIYDYTKPNAIDAVREMNLWADELSLQKTLAGTLKDFLFLAKAKDTDLAFNWEFGKNFIDVHTVAWMILDRSMNYEDIMRIVESKWNFRFEPELTALDSAKNKRDCFIKLFQMKVI